MNGPKAWERTGSVADGERFASADLPVVGGEHDDRVLARICIVDGSQQLPHDLCRAPCAVPPMVPPHTPTRPITRTHEHVRTAASSVNRGSGRHVSREDGGACVNV